MLNQISPVGTSKSGQPIYPDPTIVYAQPFNNPNGAWCANRELSKIYTSGQSWMLYHMPCFNYPPTKTQIINAMKETGCGNNVFSYSYCNYTPSAREWSANQQHQLHVALGWLGWFFIWLFIGYILWYTIIVGIIFRIYEIFVRRGAVIRRDVYTGRYGRRPNPFSWGWKFLLMFLILFGIMIYVGSQ